MKFSFSTLFLLVVLISNSQETSTNKKVLENGWYTLSTREGIKRTDPVSGVDFYLNEKPIVTVNQFETYQLWTRDSQLNVSIWFDQIGTENWRIATKKSTGSQLIFILNDQIFSSPYVNSEITAGVCLFTQTKSNRNEWSQNPPQRTFVWS